MNLKDNLWIHIGYQNNQKKIKEEIFKNIQN